MRLLGSALVSAALLLAASYVLKFIPNALQGERWSRTRARRVARLVLKHLWIAVFAASGIAWPVLKFAERSR